jgi:glyoxylase I family protein
VLGFAVLESLDNERWREDVLIHPSGVVISLQQHRDNAGEEFDPRRTGYDHVALKVDARAHLDAWTARFAQFGVEHSPVADMHYGSVLSFRDPDRTELELFYREGHP